MKKTTWMLSGSEADLHIAEFRVSADEPQKAYQQAKEEALRKLKDHVAPYLKRIEQLEADHFKEQGRLPQLKAWQLSRWSGGHELVIAKTKKRAAKLVGRSRLDVQYGETGGDWWYPYAAEEGVWVENKDEPGVYRRALGHELAASLLNAAMDRYLSVLVGQLRWLAGQPLSSQGVSVHGTPYRMEIDISDWGRCKNRCHMPEHAD